MLTVAAGCLLVSFALVGQHMGDIDPGKSYTIYDDLSADAHILLAAKEQPSASNGTWAAAPGDPGRWSLPDNDTGKSLDLERAAWPQNTHQGCDSRESSLTQEGV